MIFITSPGIFTIYNDMMVTYHLFQTLTLFVLSIVVAEKNKVSDILIVSRIVLMLYITIILMGAFIFRNENEPMSHIIPGSSTNGIPSYLILFQSYYSMIYYIEKKSLPIISILCTTFISIIGYGRGSIIVSVIMLIFTALVNFSPLFNENNNFHKIKKIIILFAIIVIGSMVYSCLDQIINFFELYTKLGNGVIDESRGEIFESYFNNLNLNSLLFGGQYAGTIIETQYFGNPHISYIRTHHLFGLFALTFIFISPFFYYLIISNFKIASVFFSFSVFSLLRAGSEPILFPSLLDIFFLLPYFILIKIKNNV